ncbi:hypothetical protein [Aquibacillus saliphilus]|uniref:hypothetical protein n=1 Tax=Aquibacillus saliphilus TaxID=1909422 RepID=UPI001CEFD479|nr:hypothetical protein [Aquibacillus saliphilus]
MINHHFERFIRYQQKENSTYIGNGERGGNLDSKTNNRKAQDPNVGARRNLE